MNNPAPIITAIRTPDTGLPDMPRPAVHPVEIALTDAIASLLAFMPTKVAIDPRMDDAKALIRDLETVCKIVDPLVRAIGEYAQSTLGISQSEVDHYFTDQLLGAIDGQAMHCLTAAMEQREEDFGGSRKWAWQR